MSCYAIVNATNTKCDYFTTGGAYVRKEKADKKVTDSCFSFEENPQRKYHVECQSTVDGTMLIRMFEYDTCIALNNAELDSKIGILNVRFPKSIILYLRHNNNTPDLMQTRIVTPNGEVTYNIPVMKTQKYKIEEIFEKNLYFLIPFYIFSYEVEFDKMESDEKCFRDVRNTYMGIMTRLEELSLEGKITEYEKQTIVMMSREVLDNIAKRHSNIQKGLGDVMGGEVLDYEAKRIKDAAVAETTEKVTKEVTEKAIIKFIMACKELDVTKEKAVSQIVSKYHKTKKDATKLVEENWI